MPIPAPSSPRAISPARLPRGAGAGDDDPHRAAATARRSKGDPQVEQVQSILKELDFYAGDGRRHRRPEHAEGDRRLPGEDGPDGLPARSTPSCSTSSAPRQTTAASCRRPAPREERRCPGRRAVAPAASRTAAAADAQIIKIQAGLKAFGNDEIEIDGVLGARTKAAIREFQSLFGLPETGEPDEAVYAKMREIGLTN